MTLAKLQELIIAAEDVEDYGKSRSETIINNFSNQDLQQLCEYWWEAMDWGYPFERKNYLDLDYENMKEFSSSINKEEFLEYINERFDEDKSDEFGCERISDELFEQIIQQTCFFCYSHWIEKTMFDNMSSRDKTIYKMSEQEYSSFKNDLTRLSTDEALLNHLRGYLVEWAKDDKSDIRYMHYDAFIKFANLKSVGDICSSDDEEFNYPYEKLDSLYSDWIDEIYDSLDTDTQKLLDLSLEDYLNTTGYSKKQLELIEKAINTGNPSKNVKKIMNSEKFRKARYE
jgi:hypothetical protein